MVRLHRFSLHRWKAICEPRERWFRWGTPEVNRERWRLMAQVLAGLDERVHAIVKAKGQAEDAGPLFA
jgi:hypothetical protein